MITATWARRIERWEIALSRTQGRLAMSMGYVTSTLVVEECRRLTASQAKPELKRLLIYLDRVDLPGGTIIVGRILDHIRA